MSSLRSRLINLGRRVRKAGTGSDGGASLDGGSDWAAIRFVEHDRFRPFDLLPAAGVFFSGREFAGGEPCHIEQDLAAPYLALELTPEGDSGSSVGGIDTGTCRIAAEYDSATGHARITFTTGEGTEILAARPVTGPAGQVAVTITENTFTLWQRNDGGWVVLLTHRLGEGSGIDLRDRDAITTSRLFYQGDFRQVRAGYFGYLGLRDPQLIREPDGEPVRDGGRFWITATCAGPGFFPAAHWGVFSFPPENPRDLCLESHLFFDRDGRRLGDHAGFILRDHGAHRVGVSSWGDFDNNAHIRTATTESNLLAGVHVLESERWNLPTGHDTWDPSLLHHEGRWWLAFVECTTYTPRFTFRPALAATAPGAAWEGPFDYVGADMVHQQTEGTLLTLLDGKLFVLASDGDARDYPVYNQAMDRIDTLDAPYPTNIPHPLVINPDSDPFILTFNGTAHNEPALGYGTHGDIIILRGDGQH